MNIREGKELTIENNQQVDRFFHIKNPAWWKEIVIYQIYPRSFQDSNGDGIGDLKGIISRLDYIKDLGVDMIWLNPIFSSPNDDNGYDISDYYSIMPEFGTMDDFDTLLVEMHKRGLKMMLDLVVNHTSDEHSWFINARKSRSGSFYKFYHWWPAEKGNPPFRRSYFDEDGYAWKYNEPTDSFYLHYFSRKQPDLNWDNPQMRQEVYKIIKFWFDKGIEGFRMDSIPLIGKDPLYPEISLEEYPDVFSYYPKSPALHSYLQEMNSEVLSKYDITTVGEGSAVRVEDASKFVDPDRKELNMLYHFGPSEVRNYSSPDTPDSGIDYSLIELKKMFTEWDQAIGNGWPVIYLGNHDQPRMLSRFGNDKPKYHALSSKMLATFILTMRGTPYWYAGDEIGMTNIKFTKIEDYNDIATINEYKNIQKNGGDVKEFLKYQQKTARDNSRTPFQWDSTKNAGFTSGKPWLKVNRNYGKINVATENEDTESILNYFKKLIGLRKANKALIYGNYVLLDEENTQIYSYLRELNNDRFLILLNFSPKKAIAKFDINLSKAKMILCNYTIPNTLLLSNEIKLRPFEAKIFRL